MGTKETRWAIVVSLAAAVYWLSVVQWDVGGLGLVGDLRARSLADIAIVGLDFGLICLGTLLYRAFRARKAQLLLCGTGTVAAVLAMALMGAGDFDSPLLIGMQGVVSACFAVFWGLSFASLDKKQAERIVLLGTVGVVCLRLALTATPLGAWTESFGLYAAMVAKIVSALPFFAGMYCIDLPVGREGREQMRILPSFYLSRCVLGGAIGALSFLVVGVLGCQQPYVVDLATGAVLCGLLAGGIPLVFAVREWRGEGPNPSFFSAIPIIVTGVFALPFVGEGDLLSALLVPAASVVYFSWAVLSSIQISDLVERYGGDASFLAVSEKAVLTGSWFIGFFALFSVDAIFPLAKSTAATLAFFALCGAVAYGSFLLAALFTSKTKQLLGEKTKKYLADGDALLYEEIERTYGLTQRESEVLKLFVEGYTRTAICKALVLSESTVKTHLAHIYGKMEVHSRSELLDIVSNSRKEMEPQLFDLLQ